LTPSLGARVTGMTLVVVLGLCAWSLWYAFLWLRADVRGDSGGWPFAVVALLLVGLALAVALAWNRPEAV
jgi:hypothetical protein